MGNDGGSPYTGRYGQAGSPGLSIGQGASGLELIMPGAPADSAVTLAPTSEDHFDLGAAGSGTSLHFVRGGDGRVASLRLGGGLELPRHPDADPPDYVVGPSLIDEPQTIEAFEALYQRDVEPADGRVIEYALEAPRSQFLSWLCARKKLLVHGSNTPDIDRFTPRRKTLGMLRGQSDSGVSACADGLWAMAYAVLDRARMRGAFHNAVLPFNGPSARGRLYHFSIASDVLGQQPPPFTDGTVYLLARDGFSRLPGPGAGLEWACPHEVAPLAKLRVSPTDFPLLSDVRGHDDRAARRFIEQRSAMLKECCDSEPHADGHTLHFEPRPGLTRDVFAFCESLRRAYPWIDLRVHVPPPPARLELSLRGSDGLRDVLDAELKPRGRSKDPAGT